ncbi:MAG TPA: acetoacetate--CoA ligase [Pseudogracilibacillus sp.]|nr:acetoacetate--CoA ligase [Pseudogracilibacillus sp.]
MQNIEEGTKLWEPDQQQINEAAITKFRKWLENEKELSLPDTDTLWEWSTTEVESFWESVWEYTGVISHNPYSTVLSSHEMPGAKWFEGATLNYTENVFRHSRPDQPALIFKSETVDTTEVSWKELEEKTAVVANYLKAVGVKKGDRVAAYMPNVPETVIAFLACASIGAIWSVCSPDFGKESVLERFKQIEPTFLFTVDGYSYNGKLISRTESVGEIQEALPSLKQTTLFPFIGSEQTGLHKNTVLWNDLLHGDKTLTYEELPFDHPLWVLFSSGTTGLPKPIVQGQGGIILEHLKVLAIEQGVTKDETYFWYTSTGWMMWNLLIGNLLNGATVVLYDGSPGYPNIQTMWDMTEELQINYFGTSAAFINSCMNAGITPKDTHDFSHLKAICSTGSPLSIDAFQWIYEQVKEDVWLVSTSGGTDVCTAFVGGNPVKSVRAGEIQARSLGAAIHAFDEAGEPLIDEVGELVLTEPMPSMPIYFWGDEDGSRYHDSYFDMYPGIWRHGDWIKIDEKGSCVIYGRSDSTINRQGVRLGTSEIYRAVDALNEVKNSLVIDLEMLDRASYMPLFVVLAEGESLTEELIHAIKNSVKSVVSPRFVPNEVFAVHQIPTTLSGKKMEVPVRKILLGQDPEKVVNEGSMANPESLQYFIDLAKELNEQK